nr:ribonuclease H-like domain-containing protein [Tanacetum cinerariifolium]
LELIEHDYTSYFYNETEDGEEKKYVVEILERTKANYNPSRTPIDTESKLGSDGDPVSDSTIYRSLVGSLQYLTFTRLDISYAVQQVCLYMHDPREPYFSALKRILRYVRGTLDYGLQLFSSSTTDLVAYSNAYWDGSPTTRCSTSDIRPIYDEEPMVEVQTTAEIDVFAIGQQHTEQPEFNNEGVVVQNAEECHDTCPLPDIFTDNQIPKHSYQSLESKNSCLKKTVAQFQKDFSRMEAHCVNLELKYQNQVLNKGQQSQFLKEKSNEAKVKHDIDVIETIIIELEHKVAKLLKENETLKKNYKELFDSIKITRAKRIKHTTSLIATNDKFKAQLQEKGFAIAALKNELRKSTGNSVNVKFKKSSILGKPMSQPLRNQSVVRQPTTFKSE